jgi:2-dehydropantoate 2-reductase
MRFVIQGAGAVGSVVAARLHLAGRDVVAVARGDHYRQVHEHGLHFEDPEGNEVVPVPVVDDVKNLEIGEDDVVMLSVKSQHTAEALDALAATAPRATPVFCLQNGVDNERQVLRRFERVYGVSVMCPATLLSAGVAQAHSSPTTGILDVGRWPTGADPLAEAISGELTAASFSSRSLTDIARWKYAKLVFNLSNAVEAVLGPAHRRGPVTARAQAEAEACLDAARIDRVTADEEACRRGDLIRTLPTESGQRLGGSTWQSLQRRTGTAETDYLNGEIVLLGRLHGVATPVNALLQRLVKDMATRHVGPGTVTEDALLQQLAAAPAHVDQAP